MNKKTEKTREHILSVGRELMAELGFSALGLGLLLREADVPKGSFYHYFSSKEEFACELLEQYVGYYHRRLDELFSKEGRSSREQLMDYWDQWVVSQCPADHKSTCLIVKLGAEVSDLSENMRNILATGVSGVTDRLSRQILKGKADGSLASEINAEMTAALLYQMWLGASLLAKVQHSSSPLIQARTNSEALLPAG
ncbi:TetR/AcrR family transcriptional regulator [Cohaesibacter haloalkalitolerans]|uniref:TetR/AcrR family transcriptional regulator n=1 Tax=Cohaesibacter haloalkalitolerans TaxID=1162980 RepID=UPI000E65EA99|nr:TetR/AcrR family transcriptional regulator [Cohaesibacter haloalkalitolerans]